ncbi:TPA: DUF551 domain-containing protein [Escherichia coli]|nr:DUF551 domain-containing protein [Escherichia coli]EFH5916604.1 DUF551 domain-containing protein [Escherichia coli]MDD6117840.1 DUF551 domain-containing protein [Escherichia coli]HAI1522718.1 DUF551 domain-containing protein [Escherichia coli]
MTTITDKKQYPGEQYLNELITNIEFAARAPVEVVRAMAAELQKRREADSAEPVAYIFKHPAGKLFWSLTDESNKEQADAIPVYAAPPVPVVPEEKPMPNPLKMYAVDAVAAIAEVRGWNACRAAMLQGKSEQPQNAQQNIPENIPGGNSPVTPDGWISCSERMPNDAQWCVVNTKYGYYVQCWSEGQGWLGDDISIPECDVINWIPLPEPPQEVNRG